MRARIVLTNVPLVAAFVLHIGLQPAASQAVTVPPSRTPAVAITSLAFTAADYPAESFRLGEQGTVAVRYPVGDTGDVTECAVTTSSGHPRLDDAACVFVSKWKYQPATLDGKAIPVNLTVNVVFQPRRDPGPFGDGVAAAQRGDFATALALWRPLAEAGVPQAQGAFASLYLDIWKGRGCRRIWKRGHDG